MSHPELPPVRVLLTRPKEQSHGWAKLIEAAGAEPVYFPTIVVGPPPSWEPLDESLARLAEYQWLLFSSAAAVRFTLERLSNRGALAGIKVGAVGKETAKALAAAGVPVDFMPGAGDEQNGAGLAQSLPFVASGTRVLFPQAMGGRSELRDALIDRGCVVDVVPASQTTAVVPLGPVPAFDVATFASPSALRAFVGGAGLAVLSQKPVVVLGETTAATARALGLVPFVAAAPDGEAMVAAVARSLNA